MEGKQTLTGKTNFDKNSQTDRPRFKKDKISNLCIKKDVILTAKFEANADKLARSELPNIGRFYQTSLTNQMRGLKTRDSANDGKNHKSTITKSLMPKRDGASSGRVFELNSDKASDIAQHFEMSKGVKLIVYGKIVKEGVTAQSTEKTGVSNRMSILRSTFAKQTISDFLMHDSHNVNRIPAQQSQPVNTQNATKRTFVTFSDDKLRTKMKNQMTNSGIKVISQKHLNILQGNLEVS